MVDSKENDEFDLRVKGSRYLSTVYRVINQICCMITDAYYEGSYSKYT